MVRVRLWSLTRPARANLGVICMGRRKNDPSTASTTRQTRSGDVPVRFTPLISLGTTSSSVFGPVESEDKDMSDSDESDGSTSGALTGRGGDGARADAEDWSTEKSVAFKFLVTRAGGDYRYESSTTRRLRLSEFIGPDRRICRQFLRDVLVPFVQEYLVGNNLALPGINIDTINYREFFLEAFHLFSSDYKRLRTLGSFERYLQNPALSNLDVDGASPLLYVSLVGDAAKKYVENATSSETVRRFYGYPSWKRKLVELKTIGVRANNCHEMSK
jgi:hypothetical protein